MQREPLSALERIRIVDNGEPLVNIKKTCPAIIIDMEESRIKNEKGLYARKTVASMLKRAYGFLPSNLAFKVRDAWRPQSVQDYYYNRALSRYRREHSEWSESRLRREVNKWIFPPDAKTPPWHTTGGAIDLTLCNKDGRSLPMKSAHDPLPQYIMANRQLLKDVMEKAGFTNYALEWWHFSYGDTGWALRTGRKHALYDLVVRI